MSAYSVAVLADSPVSYWRLGETSGTAAVDQQGVQNGVYGSAVTQGLDGAVFGDPDRASLFDGSANGFISLADVAAHNLTGDLSIECWLKTIDTAQRYLLDGVGAGTVNQGYALLIGNTRAGNVDFQVGATVYNLFTTQIHDGLWHHVVGVLSGTTRTIYIDGRASTPLTVAVPTSISTTRTIGSNLAHNGGLIGTLDEVALYNTALSASRVMAHYVAGIPFRFPVARGNG